ncbi:helix-turn-helix domain-containing protein [Hylemonella gracilis]|jgi:AraC-like DNA-binding protein|uniref:Helix-turn-helix domain-containing protein n=1 Tax=Hylemonella gracilis TaxID=80880 RepID=A0A4P6UNC3_9BURK|nr:helix-turn-helix domain-containing protein [Hylemonella gracilis]QBK05091.1 helix-turn-helix domain-containing protein [Hylemonella gracilis]
MHAATLSTDAYAPTERASLWREWNWTLFGGLESDLYGDTAFDGSIARLHAGDIILTRLEAQRHRVQRTHLLARADTAPAYLKIVAPLQGRARVEQDGREAWVGPGAWTLYDTTRGYTVDNPGDVEHLIVMLPKAQLTERGLRLDPLVARPIGADRDGPAAGIARVALSAMRSTFQELPHMSADAAHGAGELIAQLVRLSLIELAGQETRHTQREALKDRIHGYLALHLRDPALTVERMAAALNCSKRHLYNAWSDETRTLSSHIQTLRLDGCLQELRRTAAALSLKERAITEIALSWGFSNMAHFSRVFRDYTGLSPREFRASQRPLN